MKFLKKFFKKATVVLFAVLLICSAPFLFGCQKDEKALKTVDVRLTDEEYAFVVKKGNSYLKNDLNAYLDEIKENGEFEKIVKKYFGGEGEKEGATLSKGNEINGEDVLIVATNCPFEPFEYLEKDGKVYGIDMEIAVNYAKSRNLSLIVKNVPFNSIFTEIDSGHADLGMAGITVTADRKDLYDFTKPYYKASQKLIVLKDNEDFDDARVKEEVEKILKENDGLVGFQTGTTGNWYVEGDEDLGFEGFENLTGKGYSTVQLALNDLMNGNLYAVIVDEASGEAILSSLSSSGWGKKIEVFFGYLKTPSWRALLGKGLLTTVEVAVFGLIIGIFIGTLIATVKVAPKYKRSVKILDAFCSFYVALFRGTPIVVQLLLAYYVLLPALGVVSVNATVVASVVFGMNSGAYIAEIMRGGINSVDKGQTEGGRALGLSYGQTMRKIVIPQAVKNILPTLGNEFISLIKETSVVSFISVYDLYTVVQAIGSNSYDLMIPYVFLALVYVLLVLLITGIIRGIELAFKRKEAKKSLKNPMKEGRA